MSYVKSSNQESHARLLLVCFAWNAMFWNWQTALTSGLMRKHLKRCSKKLTPSVFRGGDALKAYRTRAEMCQTTYRSSECWKRLRHSTAATICWKSSTQSGLHRDERCSNAVGLACSSNWQ